MKDISLGKQSYVRGVAPFIFFLLTASVLLQLFQAQVDATTHAVLGSLGINSRSLNGKILVDLFNVDGEANIPAWFSVVQLAAASLLLFAIGAQKASEDDPFAKYWKRLGYTFLLLSLDELVSLHVLVIKPIRLIAGSVSSGALHFVWVIPAVTILIPFALSFRKFLASLPKDIARAILVAGAIYIFGAVGMEMVGGVAIDSFGQGSVQYLVCTTIEEGCEMLGAMLFAGVLLKYCEVASVSFYVCFGRRLSQEHSLERLHGGRSQETAEAFPLI